MNLPRLTALLTAITLVSAAPAVANGPCSTNALAGNWMFATGIGRQALEGFPPDKDITAIGTFHLARDGYASGRFDVTVQDTVFIPHVEFWGEMVVHSNCTGNITFMTGVGTGRTDSIVVVNRDEILIMSQDPANLWTAQARRICRSRTCLDGN